MSYRKLLVIALFSWASFITPRPTQAAEDTFCFAHISDVHIEDEGHLDKFIGAVSYFNTTLHPPFIINTGDTVSAAQESNFQLYNLIKRTSENPLYSIPGNHDNGDLSGFERVIGPANIAFTYNSYRFIGFNSGDIDFSWLEQELTQAGTGKSILFSHAPVIWEGAAHEWFNISAENREAIKDLMVRYQVLAYLSGHFHRPFVVTETHQVGDQAWTIRDISTTTLSQDKYQLICIQDGNLSNFYLGIWADPSFYLQPTPTPLADLTTVTLLPTGDTYINRWAATDCYQPILKVGYKQQNETLINFDLSAIPLGSYIKDARLKLYGLNSSGQNIFIDISPISSNWQACQANWENSHNLRGTPVIAFYTQGQNQWYSVAITSLIQNWVNNPTNYKGIFLSQADTITSNGFTYSYSFSSLEGGADNYPKLTISYLPNIISPTQPPPCQTYNQGDLNCDNRINEVDLTLLLSRWGESGLLPIATLFQNWQP